MKIKDIMSRDVQIARPGDTLQDVAARMAQGDFGFMPVADGETLLGVITDRDIAVRAVAAGVTPDTAIDNYVTLHPQLLHDYDYLEAALEMMKQQQVRRLPVVDKHSRIVGVVSLGDLSNRVREKFAGEALEAISRHAEPPNS